MSTTWRVKVHPLAQDEVRRIAAKHPDMVDAIRHLQSVSSCFDTPDGCHITLMYPDAPNCLRLKRKRGAWRVVMRLMSGGVQVRPDTSIHPGEDTYLQIIFADERTNQTYVDVRYRVQDIARS